MPQEITVDQHGVRLAAWHLPAESDALTGPGGRPCVVMAHGFGATRDSGLLPFAERFAAAGTDVVIVDYRGFGASEGALRQDPIGVLPWSTGTTARTTTRPSPVPARSTA